MACRTFDAQNPGCTHPSVALQLSFQFLFFLFSSLKKPFVMSRKRSNILVENVARLLEIKNHLLHVIHVTNGITKSTSICQTISLTCILLITHLNGHVSGVEFHQSTTCFLTAYFHPHQKHQSTAPLRLKQECFV